MNIQEKYELLVRKLDDKKSQLIEAEAKKRALDDRFKELEVEAKALGVSSLEDLEGVIGELEKTVEKDLSNCESMLKSLDEENPGTIENFVPDVSKKPIRVMSDLTEISEISDLISE